jgi:hypothetical protein
MNRRGQFIFEMDVMVVIRASDDLQERRFTKVGEMFETPRGGLLLQDMNAVTMTIFAQGEWVSASVITYLPAPTKDPDHNAHVLGEQAAR